MKKNILLVLSVIAAGITAVALTGFKNHVIPRKQPLVVERQQWTLQHMRGNIPSEEFDIGVTMDVPVNGTRFLVDSVTCLLNESLYRFFEDNSTPRFAPKELYCPDGKLLLQHYREAYKPYIVDTCEFHGGCPTFDYLSVTLMEQTDLYVTYEVSNYFIGEGDCNYLKWVTFDKRDGHRLRKVINDKDIPALLKTTDGTDYNVWYDAEYDLLDGYEIAWRCDFGLTADSLRCQYFLAPGIVETFMLDMESVRPFLTEEAEKLLGY